MDPQGNPMPPGFPLVPLAPIDIPKDPPAPADIPLEKSAALNMFILGPVPLGVFDPVREFMLLRQNFINNQALNEVILNRMVQIHQDMGWNIPIENFDPAHEDEDHSEAEAPIDQPEEIPAALPLDIFNDDEYD
jgi:hypothetical protein